MTGQGTVRDDPLSSDKAHGERAVRLPMSFCRLPMSLQRALGGSFQKISFVTALDHKLQEFLNRCWAPNQFESLGLWVYSIPTPTKADSSLMLPHLGFSLFPTANGLTATQVETVKGFCTVRLVQDSGSRVRSLHSITFISCIFARSYHLFV